MIFTLYTHFFTKQKKALPAGLNNSDWKLIKKIIEDAVEEKLKDEPLSQESKKERRDLITGGLLGGLAGAGGSTMLYSPSASASGADTAALISLQATVEYLFEEAGKLAVDLAKKQIEQYQDMFSLSTSAAEQEGNLTRTTMAAVADDQKAFQKQIYDKDQTAANQAPPTSCTSDLVLQILLNEYPEVERLRTKNTFINLNEIIRKALENGKAELKKQQVEKLQAEKEKWPEDEQLNAAISTKPGLTPEDAEKVKAFNQALIDPLASQLTPIPDDILGDPNALEYEKERQCLVGCLSQVVETRTSQEEKRKPGAAKISDLKNAAAPLVGSKDDRDRLYGKALMELLEQMEKEQGDSISTRMLQEFEINSRSLPQYDEYIRKLGGQPVPYLRELIMLDREGLRADMDRLKEAERSNLLLASLLQNSLEIEAKAKGMAQTYDELTTTTKVPVFRGEQ